MDIQNTVDYSNLFASIDQILTRQLPQLTLYFQLGKLLNCQPGKGAVTAAAKYLADQYPEMNGFSPRSLRRMRAFYRTYKTQPSALLKAMRLGWTQNVVIFEADLSATEREWYINAAYRFGWSKLVLIRMITEKAYLNAADQESVTSMASDNHIIPKNTANHGVYFVTHHDLRNVAGFYLRENAFPRIHRLNLKQVADFRHPKTKEGVVFMPANPPPDSGSAQCQANCQLC